MRQLFLLITLSFLTCILFAQGPGIKWQKCAGGNQFDYLNWFGSSPNVAKRLITPSGNYLIAGSVRSSDGDAVTHHPVDSLYPDEDIFIGETDPDGNWIWKRTYGGSAGDQFEYLLPAIDGGFIVAGVTGSNDGDVKGNHGGSDIWLLHIDENNGNILWQKCYGGSSTEANGQLVQNGTDGYVFCGISSSSDGDLSNWHGGTDLMVMQIDVAGNVKWCKNFGGSREDDGIAAAVGPDGSVYAGGYTESNDGDFKLLYPYSGFGDMCLIKLDTNGSLLWNKTYGGSVKDFVHTLMVLDNDTLMGTGMAVSSDGQVSGNHGGGDGWLFKVNTNDGSFLWQKCYGGSNMDAIYDLKILSDKSMIAAGVSSSTDITGTYNHGLKDVWVMKMTSAGDLMWQKMFGGSDNEQAGAIDMDADSSIIVLAETLSNDQDVHGNHINSPIPMDDLWLLKLGKVNTIAGQLYFDYNRNQKRDAGEGTVQERQDVIAVKGKDTVLARSYLGTYALDVDTGTYQISALPNVPYYKSAPTTEQLSFTSYSNTDSLSFAYQAEVNQHDLVVSLIALDRTRPGFTIPYKLFYKNRGTDTVNSATVSLIKDPKFSYQDIYPPYNQVKGDTIYWNIQQALKPNDTASILVHLRLSTAAKAGDTVHSVAMISPYLNDAVVDDNTSILNQLILASNDPNDKSESHGRYLSLREYSNNDYLTYTIRFQNTGTYMAYNIVVRDTLDSRFDLSSMEMISSSHPYQLIQYDANSVGWFFNYIYLPDSTSNEAGSHGYITFRIRPKRGLLPGDSIMNVAGIYFDYNPVVMTNRATTVISADNVLPVTVYNLNAINKSSVNQIQWTTSQEINIASFIIERSKDGIHFSNLATIVPAHSNNAQHSYTYVDQAPYEGKTHYRIKVINKDNTTFYSEIVFATRQLSEKYVIIPNPVKNILTLNVSSDEAKTVNLSVVDISGKVLLFQKTNLSSSENTVPVNVSSLADGVYFLKIVSDHHKQTLPFIKMNQ